MNGTAPERIDPLRRLLLCGPTAGPRSIEHRASHGLHGKIGGFACAVFGRRHTFAWRSGWPGVLDQAAVEPHLEPVADLTAVCGGRLAQAAYGLAPLAITNAMIPIAPRVAVSPAVGPLPSFTPA
jgi:hypothetical protein